jgi:antitoxin CptB
MLNPREILPEVGLPRGMLELDVIFMPSLSTSSMVWRGEQRTFIRLLECEDPELFRWCMGHGVPEDPVCRHDP